MLKPEYQRRPGEAIRGKFLPCIYQICGYIKPTVSDNGQTKIQKGAKNALGFNLEYIMKVAFPVKENKGLESILDEHFGTAPQFLIVDTDTLSVDICENQKLQSGDAKCKTGVFKKDDTVDAVVTRCMGDGSRRNLSKDNIQIYQAQENTVIANLELLKSEALKPFHIFDLCQTQKNKKEGGCGHHHD